MPQFPIFLVGAVQTIFIQLIDRARIAHAFGAPPPEAVVGVQASTTNLYSYPISLQKLKRVLSSTLLKGWFSHTGGL
jgi:hypothetical protein